MHRLSRGRNIGGFNISAGRLAFIIVCVVLTLFLHGHMEKMLDSDEASEMVYSALLAEEQAVISGKWYFSTGLNVLNTQLIYAPMLRIFDSWHVARLAALAVMNLLMNASFWFMCRAMCMREVFWPGAIALTLPFSDQWFLFVLKGGYYYPHITAAFIAVGLAALRRKSKALCRKSKGLRNTAAAACANLLAFSVGLGGPRQILMLYVPMFLSEIFDFPYLWKIVRDQRASQPAISKDARQYPVRFKNRTGIAGASFFFSALAGYLVNIFLLSKRYSVHQYQLSFTRLNAERLIEVLNGFFASFGFETGRITTYTLTHNAISMVWLLLAAVAVGYGSFQIEKVSPEYHYLSLLSVWMLLIFIMLYGFTDMPYADRYNLSVSAFSIPLILLYFRESELIRQLEYGEIAVPAYVLLVVVSGILCYKRYSKIDNTAQLRKIAKFMVEEGYDGGYATYWNANVITGLSNGSVEMWSWGDEVANLNCVDEVFPWLQKKDHVFRHPKGKICWVLTEKQNQEWQVVTKIPTRHLLNGTASGTGTGSGEQELDVNGYQIYGFDSYEEMCRLTGTYTFKGELVLAKDETGRSNTLDTSDTSEESGVLSLYPGIYKVICTGTNLTGCMLKTAYNAYAGHNHRDALLPEPKGDYLYDVETGTDSITGYFELDEVVRNFHLDITNTGQNPAAITKVSISRYFS